MAIGQAGGNIGRLLEEKGFTVLFINTSKEDLDTLDNSKFKYQCDICGFGIHLEKRPHRFDRLRKEDEKAWYFWMYEVCIDEETGEHYGWGRVLDHIGVKWEDDWSKRPKQVTMDEYLSSFLKVSNL